MRATNPTYTNGPPSAKPPKDSRRSLISFPASTALPLLEPSPLSAPFNFQSLSLPLGPNLGRGGRETVVNFPTTVPETKVS
ncbi:Uncharacterized protein HZ326_16492 [Fusarium oxysporum f. sp. albedinis]|nr:Uncharacterized protein HZ326_16492 [Fusarium oxysporum f. sp. albedinis]